MTKEIGNKSALGLGQSAYYGTGSAIADYEKPKAQSPKPKAQSSQPLWSLFDKNNTQHRTILSLLIQIGWSKPSDKWGEVADLGRLDAFLKSDKTPVKKALKAMQPEELSKIIECFKAMHRKMYK